MPNNIFSLSNGNDLFCIIYMVHAGSIYETKQSMGISHFLEHLHFKAKESVSNEIRALGGSVNAVTSYDCTYYYIITPIDTWKRAVNLMYKVVTSITLTLSDFEKERKVVLEELSYRHYESVTDVALRHIWEGTAYENDIVGTVQSLSNITIPQINEYKQIYYTRGVISFTASKHNSAIETYIKSKIPLLLDYPPRQYSLFKTKCNLKKMIVTKVHGDTNYCAFVFNGKPYSMYYNIMYEILSFILADGHSSILFNKLREDHGYIYSVFSENISYVNTGAFAITFQTTEPDVVHIVKIVLKAMKTLKKGVTSSKFKSVINSFVNHERVKYSDTFSFLLKCTHDKFYGYSFHSNIESYLNEVEGINHIDFNAFVNAALDFDKMVISARIFPKSAIIEKQLLSLI